MNLKDPSFQYTTLVEKMNKYLFSLTTPHGRWFSAFVVDIRPQIFKTRLRGFFGFSNSRVDFSFSLFVE
jgi:hypothetical protein